MSWGEMVCFQPAAAQPPFAAQPPLQQQASRLVLGTHGSSCSRDGATMWPFQSVSWGQHHWSVVVLGSSVLVLLWHNSSSPHCNCVCMHLLLAPLTFFLEPSAAAGAVLWLWNIALMRKAAFFCAAHQQPEPAVVRECLCLIAC